MKNSFGARAWSTVPTVTENFSPGRMSLQSPAPYHDECSYRDAVNEHSLLGIETVTSGIGRSNILESVLSPT